MIVAENLQNRASFHKRLDLLQQARRQERLTADTLRIAVLLVLFNLVSLSVDVCLHSTGNGGQVIEQLENIGRNMLELNEFVDCPGLSWHRYVQVRVGVPDRRVNPLLFHKQRHFVDC